MRSMGLGLPTCACMHFPSSLAFMLPFHGFLNWGRVHLEKETVDDGGAGDGSALQEIGVEDFAADHPDVLVGLQHLADVDVDIQERDHLQRRHSQ